MFEDESRKMNVEEERISLEKTHVERDFAHFQASGELPSGFLCVEA